MKTMIVSILLIALMTTTAWAEIPHWMIKEWVSPQSPPVLSGAGGVYKEKVLYYMGLDGDLNRGLYAFDYFTETSTLILQSEEIVSLHDVSGKYILYSTTPPPRKDLWLFDGSTHQVILAYDANRWFQAVKISDDYVVFQHSYGTLGNGVFLYSIALGTITQLNDPDDGPSVNPPDIDYPFVVWQQFYTSAKGTIVIYNIQTGMRSYTAPGFPDHDGWADSMCRIGYPYVIFERRLRDDDRVLLSQGVFVHDLRSGATSALQEGLGGRALGASEGNVLWQEYLAGQPGPLWFGDGNQKVRIRYTDAVEWAYFLDGAELLGSTIRFMVKDEDAIRYKHFIAIAEADTDGDGLPDSWETKGIDINGDGVIDLDLPALGADPRHKDLFVEVDRMAGVPFQRSALDIVRTSFANAPVSNPDGLNGIDLHIQIDEFVPFQEFIDDAFTDFQAIKEDSWGTVLERNHATNAENILKAKKRAFRYCLFANKFPSGSVGRGEMPGNDFVVTMGGLPAAIQTEHELATTFMHELGHNLGLNEGGGDDILFKPNYVSVMNYGFGEFEEDWTGDLLIPDFSREVMLPLDESNLDETIGIVSRRTPDVWSFFGLTDPNGVHQGIERVLLNSQPCDWNGNYDLTEVGVEMDLTWLYPHDPNCNPQTPGQILNGYDDWANLQLAIGTTGAFEDRVVANLEVQPMTVEVRNWLREQVPHRPMLADVTGDRRIDLEDWAAFAVEWRREKCGTCGGADLTGDGNVMLDDLAILAQRWLKGI